MRFDTPITLVLCALVFAACSGERQDPVPVQRGIEAVADEYLEAMLERYPHLGTRYAIAGARHDDLFDNSRQALVEWQAREDAWLAELNSIGKSATVGSRDWVTHGILHEELEASKASRICRSELWSASPITAWYGDLPFVFDIQPLDTPELRDQALLRLGKVADYVDTEIENLRMGLELGYSAPRVTVEAVPGQVRALLADDNPFVAMGGRAENEEFESVAREIFDEQIAPAIERFAAFLETEYLPQAREDIALSANPDGASCYPELVRSFATVSLSADEIHSLGLEQIKSIRAEMRSVIDEHFGGGEIGGFLRNLNIDPRFTFQSEEAVLQYALDALATARARMPEVFHLLPKADVLIKAYPAYRATGTGEYHASSEDGTRPGIFYIAVVDPKHRSRAIQQSFLYHETYPGHHLQGAIALELGDRVHPLARYLWNSGYGEGWALYSERLADEMGLYKGPLERMGMLSDQGARAARLVIDTGLHTQGWSRQRAVDYMLDNTAWPTLDIESDIDRYIAWPGQANSYMLGMLEIRRLRTLAEQELGDDFDVREFHDRVLENGSVTLPMLKAAITDWIEKSSAPADQRPNAE
jgi:uncharacterized protein (DUF885 family)